MRLRLGRSDRGDGVDELSPVNFAFTEFYEVRPFDRMQLPSVRAMVRMSCI
jgi:hypothetical protein